MTLAPATRLGPYEIVAPLGAGGMGEVYRAKDTRLGREVAIKVLPAELAQDPERLRRFELEARAASALNHPNIVTVYEVGASEAGPYLVLEKIDGRSLHELLRDGPLALKRLLAIASQIAEGLAKAHAAGIVHRDLKPANVMVTDDGFAKILDFGLARLTYPELEGGRLGQATTIAEPTASGMILGTPGYLSPEQAAGRPADFRADQFALGALLYELATGERPFKGETTGESLAAVLRDEPAPIRARNPAIPAPLAWLVERCLAKDPNDRYASTRDLARDLADLKEHLSEIARGEAVPGFLAPRRLWRARLAWSALGAALAALVGLAVALLAGEKLALRTAAPAIDRPPPTFQALTFRRGTVGAARFSGDGSTVVYSASWNGEPMQPFLTRLDAPDSRELGVAGASLLAVSTQGELALSLNWSAVDPYSSIGLLARAPLVGGALPREVLQQTWLADWAPDGTTLAVVRGPEGGEPIVEFPIGRELYRAEVPVRGMRVSPRGDLLALIESTPADWTVSTLDLAGKKTVLSRGWNRALGLAWAKGGAEIWFTATKSGGGRTLFAVDLAGHERAVASSPGSQTLHDIAPDGTVLLAQETIRREMAGLFPGSPAERDLTWLDHSWPLDLSADGRTVVFGEGGTGVLGKTGLYLRATDGGPAVRLGDSGQLARLSPDGRWILAPQPGRAVRFLLVPTGPGESRELEIAGVESVYDLRWSPDGKQIFFEANAPGRPARTTYRVDLAAAEPQALTPEGVRFLDVAPDGIELLVLDEQGRAAIQGLGGATRPLAWTPDIQSFTLARFGSDGRSIYFLGWGERAARIERLDRTTGRHEVWKEIAPADPAGVTQVLVREITPDGKSYVYTYFRQLSTLYAVRGLE